MFPEVLEIIVGHAIRTDDLHDAVLSGYRRVALPGRPYPTIIRDPASRISGKLITNLTDAELAMFDAYEEDFYVRTPVTVESDAGAKETFVYVDSRPALSFALRDWDPEEFRTKHLTAFVEKLRTGFTPSSNPGTSR